MSEREPSCTRRDFVRGTVGAALGTSLASGVRGQGARPARSIRVVLVRDEAAMDGQRIVDIAVLARMVAGAVMRVTGRATAAEAWQSLVSAKDVVGLVHTDHLNPTHKELIAVVRSGLASAGVPEDRIRTAQGGPGVVRDCTALVSIPALKAHWLTGIGTVLKNYIMFSGHPSTYHTESSVKLGEIWLLPEVRGKTRLILVDALRPLCDKGPQPDPRYLWDYKGLVAGTDPVAVETVCLKIITEKRQALRGEPWPLQPPPLCVAAADEQYGLGTSRWSEIVIDRAGWLQDALV
jgi:hypothetical protein